jgi:hypothetical protein
MDLAGGLRAAVSGLNSWSDAWGGPPAGPFELIDINR